MMKSEVLPATVPDRDNSSPSVPAGTGGPNSKSNCYVSIISIIISIITVYVCVCVCVCVCFNLLSDNESNTIRVIWYFVMLYNCLVSFQP